MKINVITLVGAATVQLGGSGGVQTIFGAVDTNWRTGVAYSISYLLCREAIERGRESPVLCAITRSQKVGGQ